jgi:hypothetical protein
VLEHYSKLKGLIASLQNKRQELKEDLQVRQQLPTANHELLKQISEVKVDNVALEQQVGARIRWWIC